MRFSVLFIIASVANTAIARSYYQTRSPSALDSVHSELEARDIVTSDAEIITHFLRSLDEDELDYVYRRGLAQKFKNAGRKIGNVGARIGHSIHNAGTRLRNRIQPPREIPQIRPPPSQSRMSWSS
jgi:hypothetical protein